MHQKDMAPDQEQQEAPEEQEQSTEILPVRGMIWDPTDQELVYWYLLNRNLGNPRPTINTMPCMEASEFYSKHPRDLVGGEPLGYADRLWFFLVRGVERSRVRVVGSIDVGFWRSLGVEESIYISNGHVTALKIHFTYYSGPPARARRTHWRMDEYTAPHEYAEIAPWTVAKVKRGRDYDGIFRNF